MCQQGANRNPWAGYRMSLSATPYVFQTEGSDIGDKRLSTAFGVVERPDRHYGDDLVDIGICSFSKAVGCTGSNFKFQCDISNVRSQCSVQDYCTEHWNHGSNRCYENQRWCVLWKPTWSSYISGLLKVIFYIAPFLRYLWLIIRCIGNSYIQWVFRTLVPWVTLATVLWKRLPILSESASADKSQSNERLTSSLHIFLCQPCLLFPDSLRSRPRLSSGPNRHDISTHVRCSTVSDVGRI